MTARSGLGAHMHCSSQASPPCDIALVLVLLQSPQDCVYLWGEEGTGVTLLSSSIFNQQKDNQI